MDNQTDYQSSNQSNEIPNDWFLDLMAKAVTSRASDIHFEPERNKFNIRFRIDGLLYLVDTMQNFSPDTIISRIKVMGKMNITERRMPQDGHFEFKYQGNVYNIRVSSIPTLYGETIVFRILINQSQLINIKQLGLNPNQLDTMIKLISSNSGMILISGPTGSGKTNLLYSILQYVNKPVHSIITVEDPIEYQMEMVRQVQANEAIGLTFAKIMRSVLRQDPDIIMVGEIRDADTAQMAMQAALTGSLVLSTFHTFDVPALVNRLLDMEINLSVIAQALKAVVSTRLVRKICPNCTVAYTPTPQEIAYFPESQAPTQLHKGNGCTHCLNTGYYGRTGIFEVVHFDNEIKYAILQRYSPAAIYDMLKNKNISNLRQSAIEKVRNGETTVYELTRVIGY